MSLGMSMYPHRTACDVLEEMRKCYSTRNFSYILGLVEELQNIFNRMEAGLEYTKDITSLHRERSELNKEIKELNNFFVCDKCHYSSPCKLYCKNDENVESFEPEYCPFVDNITSSWERG